MVNYQLGKIYKIVSDQTTDIYIGSTAEPTLARRLSKHRALIKLGKNVSSKNILQYEDAKIILIENYSCNSKDELLSREQHWHDQIKNKCNNYFAKGINKERQQNNLKQYYQDNKQDILIKCAKYREDKKEEIKIKQKEYYKENKAVLYEKRKEYFKQYRKEYEKEKIECECGGRYSKTHKNRHFQTNIHIQYLNNLNNKD